MTMLISLLTLATLQAATPAPAPVAPTALQITVPTIAGVVADPACGGRPGLVSVATCLTTTQAGVNDAVDAMNADFERQGWLAADGSDNRVVYVRRKDGGGCDAFQLLAFTAEGAAAAPAGPAYIALAAIPGDICRAQPGAAPAAATPPAQ